MLRSKNIWVLPLMMAAVVALVGWWANYEVRQSIATEVQEKLQATLAADVTALEIWMENQKRIASAFAEEPRFKSQSTQLLDLFHSPEASRSAIIEDSRQLVIGENLQERLRMLGYRMAQVVDTNFLVVADTSRSRTRIGRPVIEDLQPRFAELFQSGRAIIITPFKLERTRLFSRPARRSQEDADTGNRTSRRRIPNWDFAGEATNTVRETAIMQVAAPIRDESDVVRGALGLVIDPDAEFTRILSVARGGETGESFAFGPDGLLISRSRFDEQLKRLGLLENEPEITSALNLKLFDPGVDLISNPSASPRRDAPLIHMVAMAVKGTVGVEMTPFRDYRGVPVIGAWQWLPDYGFGVGVKIDADEAFHSLHLVRGVFTILFLLLMLSSVVIFIYTYMQMMWRIRMTEAELKVRQLGQYKLHEKLGEGGMGMVYKAHHALLRRETALKLLPPARSDPESIARFEREVRLTCRLTHPNTIQVYDYGHTPDGIFYYAMEYLDGLHLGQLVERYGPQNEARTIHILRHICESLSEAHALGLIHRDIKPANIFLCDRGGVPDSIKVLDFGLVKHFDESDTNITVATGAKREIVGTPNFIAPESINDPARGDARSDLYAVGALGYFLLSGRYIFDGNSFFEICRKHVSEIPIPPSARLGKDLNPELESLVLRCLEKDPVTRPQSAGELAQLLSKCPPAGNWTVEQRAEWWAEHRDRILSDADTQSRGSVSTEATVRIQMTDRTL